MTRYYYTDPLMAAIAARDFGVRFVDDQLNHWAECEIWEPFIQIFAEDYIHPDSYHIFEPQVGDLVECLNRYHSKIEEGKYAVSPRYYTGGADDWDYDTVKTIMRNGKLFPWPEINNE